MKRAISAIDLPDLHPGSLATGKPEIVWVSPHVLLVDETYQRDLSDRSRKLIRKIVEGFDWRRFKPPIVARTEEGLEVLDGQHSATAAVCHPDINSIPVVIVDAADRQDRASAFIGHNRDRIAVTAAQLHSASVAAGIENAVTVERACDRAGLVLLKVPPSLNYAPRETISASAISLLVRRLGEEKSVQVLRVLASVDYGPVKADHIKAVESVLTDKTEEIAPDRLIRAITTLGIGPSEKEASLFAGTHQVPQWRGLVATWIKAAKKTKKLPGDQSLTALVVAPEPVATQETEVARDAEPLDAEISTAPETPSESASENIASTEVTPVSTHVEAEAPCPATTGDFPVVHPEAVSDEAVILDLGATEENGSAHWMPEEPTAVPAALTRTSGSLGAREAPAVLRPDPRPSRAGWISGPLRKRCLNCEATYIGGLRSTQCAGCAYGGRVA